MPKLKALSNIKHDGKDYKAGDSITVNDDQAKYLIAAGAAEVPVVEKKLTAAEAKELAEKTAAEEAAAEKAAAEAKAAADAAAKLTPAKN